MFYRTIHRLLGLAFLFLLVSCHSGNDSSGKVIKNRQKEESGIEERGKALEKANEIWKDSKVKAKKSSEKIPVNEEIRSEKSKSTKSRSNSKSTD